MTGHLSVFESSFPSHVVSVTCPCWYRAVWVGVWHRRRGPSQSLKLSMRVLEKWNECDRTFTICRLIHARNSAGDSLSLSLWIRFRTLQGPLLVDFATEQGECKAKSNFNLKIDGIMCSVCYCTGLIKNWLKKKKKKKKILATNECVGSLVAFCLLAYCWWKCSSRVCSD